MGPALAHSQEGRMPVSQNIGALPFLGWIFDHGFHFAYGVMLVADIGIVWLLMWIESRRGGLPIRERPYYNAQVWGDLVFLPLYLASAAVILQEAPPLSGWYTSPWFHWGLLAATFSLSIGAEVGAVRGGQYTLAQELSPSKLWHTLIFGIVGYWLGCVLVPAVANMALEPLASAGLVAGIIGFIAMNVLDWRDLAKDPEAKTNVHMECHYFPFACFPRRR